jgi:hydrogenase-4 component F
MAEFATLPGLVALLPLAAAALAALVPSLEVSAWLVVAASSAAFALACALPWQPLTGTLLLADPLASHLALLTSFVAMTTSWFSRWYVGEAASGGAWRAYHPLFLALLGSMLLALLANNLALAWIAIAAATVAAAAAVALPSTAAALAAGWQQIVLCGVGLLLALFGTLVLYLAAIPVAGPGLDAMSWSTLADAAPHCRGALLSFAFVFLLLGYATIAALAPLHIWLADAQATGPAPIAGVLAGALPTVALAMILRTRSLLTGNAEAIAPGPPLMALGLLSLLLGGFSLWRQRDVKRWLAASTVAQSGVAAFAFGLGGGAAVFAGLLHLTLHTLAKAALWHCVGFAARLKGGQGFADIGGLLAGHRALGLTLAAGLLAVALVPPFGLFTSTFLIVTETARRNPLLSVPLGLGLAVAAWALLARLIALCLGEPTPDRGAAPGLAALLPAWLHLAVLLALGLTMPGFVVAWLSAIAESLP